MVKCRYWIVGNDWADAETTVAALARFDMQMPRPSYLVNRWLTAVVVAHDADIAELICARDQVLDALPADGIEVREDRGLEVISKLRIPSPQRGA